MDSEKLKRELQKLTPEAMERAFRAQTATINSIPEDEAHDEVLSSLLRHEEEYPALFHALDMISEHLESEGCDDQELQAANLAGALLLQTLASVIEQHEIKTHFDLEQDT